MTKLLRLMMVSWLEWLMVMVMVSWLKFLVMVRWTYVVRGMHEATTVSKTTRAAEEVFTDRHLQVECAV